MTLWRQTGSKRQFGLEELEKRCPLNRPLDKLGNSGDVAFEQIADPTIATQGVSSERLEWSGWPPGPFVQLDFTLLKRRNTEH